MAEGSFELSENISNTARTPDEIREALISKLNILGKVKEKDGKTIFSITEGWQAKIDIEVTTKGNGCYVSISNPGGVGLKPILILPMIILLGFGVGFLILIFMLIQKKKVRNSIEDSLSSVKQKFENDAPPS
jgi:hypothetical protein